MRVFVFLASGILEDGSVAFFHMNLSAFLKQNSFLNESVGFLASGILEDGSVAFLSYEFLYKLFLKQNCFFNESVCFFGFRHSGRRFRGFFFI